MNYYSFKYFNHKINIELPSIGETAIKVSICGASHYESVHLPWTSYELVAGDTPHLWIVEAFSSAVQLLADKGFAYIPIAAKPQPWLDVDDPEEPVKIPYSIWHKQDY